MLVDDLSQAERLVWDAFSSGQIVDFSTGNAIADDPAGAIDWGPERQVRGEVIAALLSGAIAVEPGRVGRVYIVNASITGVVNLQEAELKHSLHLHRCQVAHGLLLGEAKTRTIILKGCRLGPVSLFEASIMGHLCLDETILNADGEPALAGDGLTVSGAVMCGDGFMAKGEIRLVAANIGGQITFNGAYLRGGPTVLVADGLTVRGDMSFDSMRADGEIRLPGASIGGQLSFGGARIFSADRPAITANRFRVTDDLIFTEGFKTDGEIRLVGANIGGQVIFSDAELRGGDVVLEAGGLTVMKDLICNDKFRANGEVRLIGAQIGGALDMSNARLANRKGAALNADSMTVAESMLCVNTVCDGAIRLVSASVGGQLDLTGTRLVGAHDLALSADRLAVAGSMFCVRRVHY